MKWPFKDPDETLDYSIDWSRFLGTKTINFVSWYVRDENGVKRPIIVGETINGLTLGAQVNTSTVTTARWVGGLANTTYKVTCSITYGPSLVVERVVQLPVKER